MSNFAFSGRSTNYDEMMGYANYLENLMFTIIKLKKAYE